MAVPTSHRPRRSAGLGRAVSVTLTLLIFSGALWMSLETWTLGACTVFVSG